MKNEKLAAAIEKEKKNLAGYEAKITEYEEKARKSRAKLNQYEMMEKSEKFGALTEAVQTTGVSIEDILMALQTGDLLALQEQMEAAQAQKAAVAEADAEMTDEFNEELGEEVDS